MTAWMRKFLLGLGLVPVQDLLDGKAQARADALSRCPSCVECPECGAEVDTRTARAL